MGFKSFTKSFFSLSALSALSALLMIAAFARPAHAQSFDGSAEKKLRFGVNELKFKDVPVGETSETQNLVITTSTKTITIDSIEVKEPFIETECSCVFVSNNVGTQVDCDSESLPLDVPPATTCTVGVAFQPTFTEIVDKPHGMRIDFGAHNAPKHVRLFGIGVE